MLLDPRDIFAHFYWRAVLASSPVTLFDRLLDQRFYSVLLAEQLAVAEFPSSASVLELGCGPGALRSLAQSRDLKLTGVDRSEGMLARAAERPGPAYVQLLQGEAHEIALPDNSFDGAFCASLLHLVDDPSAVLSELARVLRPGATLLIAGPEPSFSKEAAPVVERDSSMGAIERGALRLWSSRKIRMGSPAMRELIESSKFQVDRITPHFGDTMFSLRATLKA